MTKDEKIIEILKIMCCLSEKNKAKLLDFAKATVSEYNQEERTCKQ